MSEPIKYDLAWLKSISGVTELKAAMLIPEARAQVNELLRTREAAVIASEMINNSDYVPAAKREAQAQADAIQAEADHALADHQAAADAVVPEPVIPPPAAPVEEKKKIVVDYQATAEDGTPIGRPTHIEGWSYEEVIEKMKTAHVNAVRYAERIKKNKIQSIEAQTQQSRTQEQVSRSEAEANAAVEVAAKEKDPVKLAEAIRKVNRADREAQIAAETQRQHGRIIGDAWKADHKEDYLPCDANSQIIGKWLTENNRELSYENLELAFEAKKNELAKPEPQVLVQETPEALASNAPAAPAVVVPSAPPSIPAPAVPTPETVLPAAAQPSQPALTAPAPTPAAAPNTQPAARRPGVNGSLPPGTLTAVRPTAQQTPPTTTTAELKKVIAKMPRDEYRKKLKSPEFVAQLRAAGIPVVGQRN